MLRRILIISAFVAFTLGIGFALWFFFFRPPSAPLPTINANVNAPPPGGLPGAGPGLPGAVNAPPGAPAGPAADRIASGGLTSAAAITPIAVDAPSLSPTGDGVRFYDRDTGKFYRVDPDTGERLALSDKRFPDVETVAWAPTEDKAVMEFPDGSNVMFDFQSQRQVTLPRHWEEFQFSSDSRKLASKSLGIDPSNRWLVVSNADGSSAVPIQELGNNEAKVSVNMSPTGQVVAFSRTGESLGFGRQEILLIGQNKENFKGLVVEGLNFQGQWAPDGKRLIYSAVSPADDYRPMLWITDAFGQDIGSNRRKLNINTWADKCSFAGTSLVYCAVPRTMERGVGLERRIADTIPDDLYSINLATGARRLVARPDSDSTMTQLMVTPDGRTLTFVESGTDILRQIRLAP